MKITEKNENAKKSSGIINPVIIEKIFEIARQFGEKYIYEDGLKRAALARDIRNYRENKKLIEAILSDDYIVNHYTTTIAGKEIFQLDEFAQMLQYREYWETSYTKYQKQIGLTTGGRYLHEQEEVVIDFPFKDGIITAGMSNEDNGYDDSFFNEVIEKDEIDRLFSPKILQNVIKYDQSGKQPVSKITKKDNLILKGNNLIALHSLKERYVGLVKMIYIDPPYFFKKDKEKDAFAYNSNFHMSTWLTFMKNRLEIAKELLVDGGTIWISISEDGMHYLKVLADSIFGADRFLGTTPRRTRNGKSDVPFNYSQDFDFLLAYTNVSESNNVIGRKVDRKYYDSYDYPNRPWRLTDSTTQKNSIERPNSDFTMIDPKTGKEYPVNKKRTWAVTKDTFQKYYDEGYIVFPDDYDFLNISKPYIRKFKDEDDASGKLSSVISDFAIQNFLNDLMNNSKNKAGNEEVAELVPEVSFKYPKPENLLKSIIEISTDEGDIVLDFFMGSATTPAVAMKMNRQFIGIEQMDYIDTLSVPRLQKVINGEQGGVSISTNWNGGGSFIYAELFQKNMGYLKDIINSKSSLELKLVFERMISGSDTNQKADIDFRADLSKLDWNKSFVDNKRLLIKILDKNQLYYNYSEIEDKIVKDLLNITDSNSYTFNKSFYESGE